MIINIQNFLTKNIPQKIAIYRFGSFGNSIITFPAIRTIRKHYPNAEIYMYNKPENDNLIKMENLLDENLYNKIITLKVNLSAKELYNLVKNIKIQNSIIN